MPQTEKKRFAWMPAFAIGAAVITLGGGAFAFVHNIINSSAPPPKKLVQEIQIVRPPPPPPDAPPPPPPPPQEEVDIPENEPERIDEAEAPPMESLGLDAEGGAGGDQFGLVGRKGGRDLLGSSGSAFAWYAGLLKGEILDRLQDVQAARAGAYSVVIKVWVRSDGTIERIALAQSTGNRERDTAIESELSRITRISQGPPADMPQPVSLKLVSRA